MRSESVKSVIKQCQCQWYCYELESYFSPTWCNEKKIVVNVDNDNPQEYNHIIPETGDLVVTEKGDTDQLKPSSSDINANDINISRTDISVNNASMDKLVARVNDNNPTAHNHTIPETLRQESQ